MIHRSRALFVALALVSCGPVLARHDRWEADSVNPTYGSVGQCGRQPTIVVNRGTVVGPYSGNVVYGQPGAISFPVNSGGVQYYDARTGGRYVGPSSYTVNYAQPYGATGVYNQINNAYGPYNNQIQYHQYSGNPYVGVNPWNGYTGNTYNGYTYTQQPYYNGYNGGAVSNGAHPAGCSCCAHRSNNNIYRSGGSANWMWNRR